MSQFHYGSIKTEFFLEYLNEIMESQFHYGSIKTTSENLQRNAAQIVSIPLWFD